MRLNFDMAGFWTLTLVCQIVWCALHGDDALREGTLQDGPGTRLSINARVLIVTQGIFTRRLEISLSVVDVPELLRRIKNAMIWWWIVLLRCWSMNDWAQRRRALALFLGACRVRQTFGRV